MEVIHGVNADKKEDGDETDDSGERFSVVQQLKGVEVTIYLL